MVGGRQALGGHVVASIRDLLLAHLEQHLGSLELVVGPGLLPDDDVAYAVAAGEVLGRHRVEQRGEGDQVGVALGIHVGDGVRDLLALVVAVGLALDELGLRDGELGLRDGELGLHLGVALGRDLEPAARGGEVGLGIVELALRGGETSGGLLQLRAGLVEVLARALELLLDLALLVLEVVGLSAGDRGDAQGHDHGKRC